MSNVVTPSSSETDSFTDRPIASALSGCMYAGFVIAASVAMLLINAFVCLTAYSALPEYAPPEITSRIGQFFYFTAPVILMVVQWNLIDRVGRIFTKTES